MESLKPTYDFFTTWGGGLDSESFKSALPAAFARVKARCCTIDLTTLTEAEETTFKNAVCAACEALSSENAGISSYSAGKVSVTFSEAETRRNSIEAAIERELSGTRLISVVI